MTLGDEGEQILGLLPEILRIRRIQTFLLPPASVNKIQELFVSTEDHFILREDKTRPFKFLVASNRDIRDPNLQGFRDSRWIEFPDWRTMQSYCNGN